MRSRSTTTRSRSRQISIRASRTQTERLLAWAAPFEERTWAVEGADGIGYLLSQQLIAAGERVVDVPATLAARTRVLGSGRSNKTDPNDARSVALTALRHDRLHEVQPVGHTEVLRLLAKRNTDIGDRRTQVVARMHSLLVELAPGGIAKEINASDVDAFLAGGSTDEPGGTDPLRPGGRVARRDPSPRQPTEGIAQADPDRGRRGEHDRDRPVRDRAGHRRRAHRLHRRHQPVREPGPLRRLQRHRSGRVLFRRPTGPSRVRNAATVASTTRCTWPRSASSVTHTPTGVPTSTARSLRARPSEKRSARSSVRSATPSTANSSSTPDAASAEKQVREDT